MLLEVLRVGAKGVCGHGKSNKTKCWTKCATVIVQDVRGVFYFVCSCTLDSMAVLEVVHCSSEGAFRTVSIYSKHLVFLSLFFLGFFFFFNINDSGSYGTVAEHVIFSMIRTTVKWTGPILTDA